MNAADLFDVGGALLGYLVGSFPTGYLVVRWVAGRDVLATGSGRMGAANALRAGGRLAFGLTMAGDFAKGIVAILLARALIGDPLAGALAGIGAILGHDASIVLRLATGRFRGGAGTATFAGGAIFLWPPVALLTIPVVPVALYLTGYASVASTLVILAILGSFAVRVAGGLAPWSDLLYAVGGSLLVVYAHLPNYRRLWAGEERVIGPRARRLAKRE